MNVWALEVVNLVFAKFFKVEFSPKSDIWLVELVEPFIGFDGGCDIKNEDFSNSKFGVVDTGFKDWLASNIFIGEQNGISFGFFMETRSFKSLMHARLQEDESSLLHKIWSNIISMNNKIKKKYIM